MGCNGIFNPHKAQPEEFRWTTQTQKTNRQGILIGCQKPLVLELFSRLNELLSKQITVSEK